MTGARVVITFSLLVLASCATTPETSEEVQAPYSIRLSGNREIGDRRLERAAADELLVLTRDGKPYQADDAAYALEEFYNDQGFHAARVRYAFEEDDRRVKFLIEEGPRAFLGRVSMVGRGPVEKKTLLEFLVGPTQGGRTFFIQSNVDGAAKLIAGYYLVNGYMKVRVDGPRIAFRREGTVADVDFYIRPGPQFIIREVRFNGFVERSEQELIKLLGEPLGNPYTNIWPRQVEGFLGSDLRRRGFVNPEIDTEAVLDEATGGVVVTFKAIPGKKRKVGEIHFSGIDRASEGFLYRRLTFAKDEIFDGGKVEESTRRLYATGIFSKVNLEEVERGEDQVDITYYLTERDARSLDFLAGFGSYELLRGAVVYTDRNLGGRGLIWRTSARASMRSMTAETSLSDRTFLNLPLTGTLEAKALRRQEPSFVAEGYTLVAALSKEIYTDLNGRLGYAYTQSRSTLVSADIQPLEPEGSVATGGIFTRFVLDKRDNWLWPKRGSVNEVSAESNLKVLGGDLDYNKLEGRSYWYLSLYDKSTFVLAFGARAGVIVRGHGTDLIPIQYRFFNGGYDSVRSFRYNELGPKVNGDPTGGEFYSTGNVELRMPGFILDDLGWTVFWDVGNVIFRREDIGFDSYSNGLGAGVRYDLPIGPIRVDWGWNPNPKEDERDWALHLSVGFAF